MKKTELTTHHKGDIAVGKVIAELLVKGWHVFTPVSTHACSYDLIASKRIGDKDRVVRLQVKYKGVCAGKYKDPDAFDFFAVYNPDYDRVIYISYKHFRKLGQKHLKIAQDLPNSSTPFFWWEDFTELKPRPLKKRKLEDFGKKRKDHKFGPDAKRCPITLSELQKLLWQKSKVLIGQEIGLSDKAVGKWCEKFGLISPPTGYYGMSDSKKAKVRKRYKESVERKFKELKSL